MEPESVIQLPVSIYYLIMVTVFTAVMWIPYVINAVMVRGLVEAVSYPECPKPLTPWAVRLKAAHYNAIENLTPFAALVLSAQVLGVQSELIDKSAMVYLVARILHAVSYTLAIPWARTGFFTVGWVAMLCIAWELCQALMTLPAG